MKKGFTLIDFIITFTIITIIGIISTLLVINVINNIKQNGNKILIDNYVNDILYSKEVFMKKNNNILPKYCKIIKDVIYYDENYNDVYDSNELLCSTECESDNCIKYFITKDDINNKDIKCNKIIIEENSIEVSNCYINNKQISNYKYRLEFTNTVE